jgi:tetratricopeptide (TPR) repeat protein
LLEQPSWIGHAALSSYQRPDASSDTVLRMFGVGLRMGPQSPEYVSQSLKVRAHVIAGLGQWRKTRLVLDSLKTFDPEAAIGIEAWSIVLGLTPPSLSPRLDSIVKSLPPGPESQYGAAMLHLFRGRISEGRQQLARALAARDGRFTDAPELPGFMIAADGLGLILQGDSVTGIRRLRQGLDSAAAPKTGEESAYLRLQLALALAARRETRAEGIQHLKYGFDHSPLYLPLTELALGQAYEAAGQRDSAAHHYQRFLRLWDKADPELQSRVGEAQTGLAEVTREQPGS